MPQSLRYTDLLARQAELQEAGKAFLLPHGRDQIEAALLAECGELAQECKADWTFWNKPGQVRVVKAERVLDEAADVLHFLLLLDLWEEHRYAESQTIGLTNACQWEVATILTYLVAPGPWGLYRAELLCDLLAHYDYTPDDLVDAYWAKSEENLRRWQAAAEPEVPAKPEPQFMYVPSMDPSYPGMIVPIVPDSATPEELAEADRQLRQWALYVLIALFVAGCLAVAWMVSGGTL